MNIEPPPIDSRTGFAAAVLWGFETAIGQGARRIVAVDADFADWPLDDAALHARLTAWLRQPLRELVLLAMSYDEVPRRHPRFVAWRRSFTHVVHPFSPSEGTETTLPTLLLDDGPLVVQRHAGPRWAGRAALDAKAARAWRETIDAVLQRSEPSFAANHLGL